MNNHKLIMEGWRKFISESRASVREINGKQICLYYHSKHPPGFSIVLYIVGPREDYYADYQVIGGIDCIPTEDPCIPKTLQVGTSYRHSDYAGKGLGPLVYDLAFFIAQSIGYGLTSDRETGSKKAARDRWSKIEANPNYEKQKTKAGNDKFDYYNDTPDDPDDDCTKDLFDNSNATDHSFIKKDSDQIHSTLMDLEANHMDYLDSIPKARAKKQFLMDLRMDSTNLFTDEYDLAEGKKPTPDGSGPLGQYVFPRDKTKKYKSEEEVLEKDTAIETELRTYLGRHLTTGNKSIPQKVSNYIVKLAQSNSYPDIFKMYTKGEVYRGLEIDKGAYNKLFGETPKKKSWWQAPIDWLKGRATQLSNGLKFSPKTKPKYRPSADDSLDHKGSLASSWTPKFRATRSFRGATEDGKISIVLVADASKGQFIDLDGLYDRYEFARDYRSEREVIAIGDVPIEKIYVYDPVKKENIQENWRRFLLESDLLKD